MPTAGMFPSISRTRVKTTFSAANSSLFIIEDPDVDDGL